MARNNTEVKKSKFLEVFRKKMCNINATCKAVDISRQTFYNWLDKFDSFKKGVEEIEDALHDDVESKMLGQIFVDNNPTMMMFYAKTKMKHRGYVEQFSHNHSAEVVWNEEKTYIEVGEPESSKADKMIQTSSAVVVESEDNEEEYN